MFVVTLEEATLDFFLFIFTHVLTKEVVQIVLTDLTNSRDRYSTFQIDTSILFANKHLGEWHYEVYEQETESGDPTNLLENGKMMLTNEEFEFTMYQAPLTYKAYAG